jgi:hypothetical protein
MYDAKVSALGHVTRWLADTPRSLQKDAIVANNPLFANPTNKAYNPIFYSQPSSAWRCVVLCLLHCVSTLFCVDSTEMRPMGASAFVPNGGASYNAPVAAAAASSPYPSNMSPAYPSMAASATQSIGGGARAPVSPMAFVSAREVRACRWLIACSHLVC